MLPGMKAAAQTTAILKIKLLPEMASRPSYSLFLQENHKMQMWEGWPGGGREPGIAGWEGAPRICA